MSNCAYAACVSACFYYLEQLRLSLILNLASWHSIKWLKLGRIGPTDRHSYIHIPRGNLRRDPETAGSLEEGRGVRRYTAALIGLRERRGGRSDGQLCKVVTRRELYVRLVLLRTKKMHRSTTYYMRTYYVMCKQRAFLSAWALSFLTPFACWKKWAAHSSCSTTIPSLTAQFWAFSPATPTPYYPSVGVAHA